MINIMIEKDKKYPKSKSGLQCITPCYPAKSWTIHPISLIYHTSDFPYCHVNTNLIKYKDYHYDVQETDKCTNPITQDEYKIMDINVLIPTVNFSCKYFLMVYYDINTFDDGLKYISKYDYKSIITRSRIMNCMISVFIKDIEYIDNRFLNFFVELIKKKWISDIYKKINKYIKIENNSIKFTKPDETQYGNDYKIEKINFIMEKLLKDDDIHIFLSKYIEKLKENEDEINDYIEDIKNNLIIYIENKINISV